jgi:CheY-like chemotaxis protein
LSSPAGRAVERRHPTHVVPFSFLVLEDDPDIRHLNVWRLNRTFPNCVVTDVASVPEGLSAAASMPFDAILTDHHLGDSDGIELIRQLRQRGLTCPVLMVTNSIDPKLHQAAMAAGATRVFNGENFEFASYLKDVLGP